MSHAVLLVAMWCGSVQGIENGAAAPWPSFRGVAATGLSSGPAAPVDWDLDTGEHVLWRVEVPGLAHSSPVLGGGRVYLTNAEGEKTAELKVGLYGAGESAGDEGSQVYSLWCLDAESGEVLWEEVCHEGVPKVQRHPKASHASSTPSTNGKRVVAFFGSEGLYCYDAEGNRLWDKDLGTLTACAPGVPDLQWGFASSPVIHEDVVLIQCDVHEESFLAALDLETGEERWRTPRVEGPGWCTPTVHVEGGRSQVIANGYQEVAGYDLETGRRLWWFSGGGDVPVPTPVVAHGLIYLTSAHGRLAPIHAIRAQAEGELDPFGEKGPFVAWSHPRKGSYMQTPLVVGDHLYLCTDAGALTCFDARTGAEIYRERIGDGQSGFSASGVASGDHLYYTSEQGQIHVIKAGPRYERVAVHDMAATCMATPAIVDGRLYVRTRHELICLGE